MLENIQVSIPAEHQQPRFLLSPTFLYLEFHQSHFGVHFYSTHPYLIQACNFSPASNTGVEYLVLNGPLPLWGCWSILLVLDALSLVPTLLNLNILGNVVGPATMLVLLAISLVLLVVGVQLFGGKWLIHLNIGERNTNKTNPDDYLTKAGKVFGVFALILALGLALIVVTPW